MNSESLKSIAALVAVLAGSAAAGAALAIAPWHVSVALIVGLGGLLVLAIVRAALSPRPGVQTTEGASGDEYEAHEGGLQIARRLYYLGAATIGFLTIRPALSFTASDWIFLLSLAATCAVLLTARHEIDYRVHRAVTIGVALFTVGGIVSSTQAESDLQSVAVVVRLLYLTLVWFWLGTIVLQRRRHVEYAVLAWVLSAAVSSGAAVVQFFQGDVIPGGIIEWGRMSGLTPHFNNLAGLAATAFVPALMLAVDSRQRLQRAVALASLALIGAGLLLSGSVGGLTAAFVATLLWLFLRGVTRRTVVIMIAVVVCGLMLMSAYGGADSPSPLDRVRSVTSTDLPVGQGGSLYSRLDVYRLAWGHIRDQPLVGVGLDEASWQGVLGPVPVHNLFISPWFSAGILGLVGVVLLVGGTLRVGADLLRHTTSAERNLVAAVFSGFVAFLVFALAEPILYVRYGWFPAALLLALHAQERRAIVSAHSAVAVSVPRGYRPRAPVYEMISPSSQA